MQNSAFEEVFAQKWELMNKINPILEAGRNCALWKHRKKTGLKINCAWLKSLKIRWVESKECRPL